MGWASSLSQRSTTVLPVSKFFIVKELNLRSHRQMGVALGSARQSKIHEPLFLTQPNSTSAQAKRKAFALLLKWRYRVS
jgi:hypothetical protein